MFTQRRRLKKLIKWNIILCTVSLLIVLTKNKLSRKFMFAAFCHGASPHNNGSDIKTQFGLYFIRQRLSNIFKESESHRKAINSYRYITWLGLFIPCHFSHLHHLCTNTHTHTHTPKHSRQTEAGPQILSCAAGAKSPEWLSDSPRFKAPGAGQSHRSSRAELPRSWSFFLFMSEFVETRITSGGRREDTSPFPSFLFFFYMHKTAFCSPLFFI